MNTLLYTKRLEQMGVSREDAEAFVTVNSEMIMNEVATKADLKVLRADFKVLEVQMDNRFTKLESKVEALESKMDIKFNQFKNQIVIQLGSLIVAGLTALASFISILKWDLF